MGGGGITGMIGAGLDALVYAPLRPFGWVWWLLLPLVLPRRVEAWLFGLLALLVRSVFDADRIFMGSGYAPHRLNEAHGLNDPHILYGDGWATLHAPPWAMLGHPAQSARTVNLALSVLAPVLLWSWLDRIAAPRAVRRLAPALLAILPLAVAMARTEDHFVTVATLQVAALAGLAAPGRVGRVFGALSAGLVAHVRPDELPFALGVVALAVWQRRWGFTALAGALAGWRAVEIVSQLDQGVADSWIHDRGGWGLQRALTPSGGLVLFDPATSPVVLPALIVLGIVVGRRRHDARIALAAALVTALPFIGYHYRTDILRFQLPAMTWWCVLAAGGLAWATTTRLPLRLVTVGALSASIWVARRPLGPLPTWAWEYRLLEQAATTLPPGAVVRFRPVVDRGGHFQHLADDLTQATWVPLEERAIVPGEWLWLGRDVHWPDLPPMPSCTTTDVLSWTVPVETYGIEPAPEPELTMSLGKVAHCP